MAADRGKREFRAGVFVAGTLVVFGVIIFFLGEKREVFTSHYLLRAYFDNVSGLISGAAVRLQGVQVGNVEAIGLPRPDGKKRVVILLKIEKKAQKLVREDSVAHVETMGVLGDKYVEISIGSSDQPMLRDRAEIQVKEGVDVFAALQKGGEVLQNVSSISERLNQIMEQFQSTNTLKNLDETTASVRNIVREVETGQGVLHALIYEPQYREIVTHFAKAMQNLDAIVEDVRTGEGTAHALIYDPAGKRLLKNLSSASGSLDQILAEVRAGRGTLHSLIYTDEGKGLMKELEAAAASLQNILSRVEQGDGTLGALIKDPSLYNDLAALLQGVRRSSILKLLIDYGLENVDGTAKTKPSDSAASATAPGDPGARPSSVTISPGP